MSRVLLISPDRDLAERVHTATGGAFLTVSPDALPGSSAELFGLLPGVAHPEVVVLDAGPAVENALSLAGQLDRTHGISVVLVSDSGDSIALAALRAGVLDILPTDVDPAGLRAALDRASQVAATRAAAAAPVAPAPEAGHHRGTVVTVASPKGGVGKTTVATNIAVGLAQLAPQATVLVDLDVHFGDVASALNLNPQYTLPDMVHGPAAHDAMALKTFLSLHESGLFVIPGSDSPVAADTVTSRDITNLLQMLAAEFRFVVVDTAPGLSEHTLAVLDHTDQIVLVTSLDVPGVRGLRKELDTLNDLGMLMGGRHVVLNFNDPNRGLTVKDVEATIRTSVDVVLPQSTLVPVSVNQGIPLLQSNGRDPVTRQLRQLVELLVPSEENAEPTGRRGLLGFRRGAKETR